MGRRGRCQSVLKKEPVPKAARALVLCWMDQKPKLRRPRAFRIDMKIAPKISKIASNIPVSLLS